MQSSHPFLLGKKQDVWYIKRLLTRFKDTSLGVYKKPGFLIIRPFGGRLSLEFYQLELEIMDW